MHALYLSSQNYANLVIFIYIWDVFFCNDHELIELQK